MIKFLVRSKIQWMDLPSKLEPTKTGYERRYDIIDNDDSLNNQQKRTKLGQLLIKYEAIEQIGDIIEVRREDAVLCGLEPESFLLVGVDSDNYTYEDVLNLYSKSLHYPPEQGGGIKRRRMYNLDIAGLAFIDNEVKITEQQFINRLTVKE